MAGTVKIPGIGPVKTVYVVAGVGVLGGILVFAYWRRASQPPPAPAPATDATDTTAEGSYTEASDAAGYNTVVPSAYGQSFSPYGYDLYGNPLPPPTGAGTSGGPFVTNADWATAAESALENAGVTLATSTTAVSRVLAGLTVTSDQRDIFMQAVGLLGQPPQGYPTPVKLVDTPAQPGPTTPAPPGSVTGLHATGVSREHVDLAWTPVSDIGISGYEIFVNGVYKTTAVYASEHVWGLHPGTSYKLGVRAAKRTAQGKYTYGPTASVNVRTKK